MLNKWLHVSTFTKECGILLSRSFYLSRLSRFAPRPPCVTLRAHSLPSSFPVHHASSIPRTMSSHRFPLGSGSSRINRNSQPVGRRTGLSLFQSSLHARGSSAGLSSTKRRQGRSSQDAPPSQRGRLENAGAAGGATEQPALSLMVSVC